MSAAVWKGQERFVHFFLGDVGLALLQRLRSQNLGVKTKPLRLREPMGIETISPVGIAAGQTHLNIIDKRIRI
jgi:hypothetical protein